MDSRLDSLMVSKGLVTSRERAKELIILGQLYIDSVIQTKPSFKTSVDSDIEIKGEVLKYVSRGGLKLEKAINSFNIDLNEKVCADIGASTGGFTDCMLQNGANKVYAVDVGHNQLVNSLINNENVINIEGVNARYLTDKHITEKVDFISIDVSFISLTLVLPTIIQLLKDDGNIVCLIKPQFEAGKNNIGKNGVVKSKTVHKEVLDKIHAFVQSIGMYIKALTFSPIKGPEGNIEYVCLISKSKNDNITINNIEIVEMAFNNKF